MVMQSHNLQLIFVAKLLYQLRLLVRSTDRLTGNTSKYIKKTNPSLLFHITYNKVIAALFLDIIILVCNTKLSFSFVYNVLVIALIKVS